MRGAQRRSPVVWRRRRLLDVSRAARARPRRRPRRAPSDLLLDGLARCSSPRARRSSAGAEAGASARSAATDLRRQRASMGLLASSAAVELWDFESWDALVARADGARARRRGAGPAVDRPERRGHRRGDLARRLRRGRARDRRGAMRSRRRQGRGSRPTAALLARGLRGREDEAGALIDADDRGRDRRRRGARRVHRAVGDRDPLQRPRPLRGRAGRGTAGERGAPELFLAVWALPELIEAAVRSGNADLARAALERLAESDATPAAPTGGWASRRVHARC